jgi:hypothetical protein
MMINYKTDKSQPEYQFDWQTPEWLAMDREKGSSSTIYCFNVEIWLKIASSYILDSVFSSTSGRISFVNL